MPVGGKKGQVLKKQSDEDYDTAWEDDNAGSVVDLSDYYTKEEIDDRLSDMNNQIMSNMGGIDSNYTSIRALEEEVYGVDEILESVSEGGAF